MPNDKPSSVYEDRIVAFVDVLGFSELVNSSKNETNLSQSIKQIVEELDQTPRRFQPRKPTKKIEDWYAKEGLERPEDQSSLEYSQFSDCLVISSKVSQAGIVDVFMICFHISLSLLKQGYLIRGGIVRGDIFHNGSTVFGPAFLKAYKLDEIGAPPRIVLSKEVREAAFEVELLPDMWPNAFRIDEHDLQDTLPPLFWLGGYKNKHANESPMKKADVEQVGQTIETNASNWEDHPTIRAKWLYMLKYWNEISKQNVDIPKLSAITAT